MPFTPTARSWSGPAMHVESVGHICEASVPENSLTIPAASQPPNRPPLRHDHEVGKAAISRGNAGDSVIDVTQ
jgi:hypothetical protein